MRILSFVLIGIGIIVLMGWALYPSSQPSEESETPAKALPTMQIAHLADGDQAGLEAIRESFSKRNPGYDLAYYGEAMKVPAASKHQVVFIQTGGGTATLSSGKSSKVSVGDIVILGQEESLEADSALDMLAFIVPKAPPANIPSFIRPDWDLNITDTPGGCATETNAYRRILLTWLGKVGPYLYHAINAHRVRIMDSFTHYHPEEGGFDEFYLVQMVMPHATIITSNQVDAISNPDQLSREDVPGLLQETKLQVGDLVYLPRGVIHRGVNGVLAQVITTPGFVPKSEIGVDHHLRKINERLKLTGKDALPYNQLASEKAIIK